MSNILRTALVAASLLAPMAHADNPVDFYIGGWSHHWVSNNMNETHNLVAMEWDDKYVVGVFNNSYSNISYLGLRKFNYQTTNFDLFAGAGVVYGYEGDQLDPFPTWGSWAPLVTVGVTWTALGVIQPTLFQMGEATVLSFKVDF